MKTRKLICPKCGNTKNFRVDAQITLVSTLLTFNEESEAELDTDIANEIDIMCPVCDDCDAELEYSGAELHVMCPSCVHYVDADVVETCPHIENDYPSCFAWAEGEAELKEG